LNDVTLDPEETGFLLTKRVKFKGELLPRFRDAPVAPHFKMTLSEGYKATSWGQQLSAVLSYLTDVPSFSMLKRVTLLSEPMTGSGPFIGGSMAHAEMKAQPQSVSLTEDLLKEALSIVEGLTSDPSKELVLRAIGWYSRGVADTSADLMFKFMDHWISLETLSNTYRGKVKPTKCRSCGQTLSKRPVRSVLREFLTSLGYQESVQDIMKCSDIRNRLFHRADAEDEARDMQPILTLTLRNCILKTLKNE